VVCQCETPSVPVAHTTVLPSVVTPDALTGAQVSPAVTPDRGGPDTGGDGAAVPDVEGAAVTSGGDADGSTVAESEDGGTGGTD
jgi:hypothetical protein